MDVQGFFLRSLVLVVHVKCFFWNCGRTPLGDGELCKQHQKKADGQEISRCRLCAFWKPVSYPQCKRCLESSLGSTAGAASGEGVGEVVVAPLSREYSPAWEKGDEGVDEYYAYLLQLEDGSFYPGMAVTCGPG